MNPNSTVKISTDEGTFFGIYVCLGALKRGFLEGCRRVVCLDAFFMKGPWKGQIYSAIGRDANNQMYPIAWGIGARENHETWNWFLSPLKDDLEVGDGHNWTFISDQQKAMFST